MSNIAGSSVYSTANTSTSTLRPRNNNRLISYLEEAPSDHDVSSQAASISTTRGGSPSAARSRSRNITQTANGSSRQTQSRVTDENTSRGSSSLWGSWSSIQGVASSLLSGGESSTSVTGKGSIKTPVWMKQDPKFKTATARSTWGPEDDKPVVPKPSSIEDRQALVQAKKREALLLSCAQESRDESGHFKRKASYDAGATRALREVDTDKDALVYKHKVQPHDTMAGVTIKFNCQPEAFRKTNRFWPNDNIQTRSYVLLPVDACSVRGRKVDDATGLELLTTQLNNIELDTNTRSTSSNGQVHSTDLSPTVTSPWRMLTDEEDYRHDSYVVLPSFSEPVEILRIPRKSTGYFPRARRKSSHLAVDSGTSTPKTSFDMLRHPPTHAAQQAAAALALAPYSHQSTSLNASPVRRPRLASSSRQRSSSTTTTTNANSNTAWILRGPGGVGTLRGLRTEVSRPGPADDSLNQKFAQYFPGLAAQSDLNDPVDSNNLHPRSRTNTMSRSPYRSTPRVSTDSIRSTQSNSSTFGAGVTGVESFMRKLTTGGKRPDMPPRSSSGNVANLRGIPIGGETGLGDLIELETNPDALHHDQVMRMERGDFGYEDDDDATPTEVNRNQDDLLNERFPVRGRITRAYGRDEV